MFIILFPNLDINPHPSLHRNTEGTGTGIRFNLQGQGHRDPRQWGPSGAVRRNDPGAGSQLSTGSKKGQRDIARQSYETH